MPKRGHKWPESGTIMTAIFSHSYNYYKGCISGFEKNNKSAISAAQCRKKQRPVRGVCGSPAWNGTTPLALVAGQPITPFTPFCGLYRCSPLLHHQQRGRQYPIPFNTLWPTLVTSSTRVLTCGRWRPQRWAPKLG